MREVHEECGVFGIFSPARGNLAHLAYYGLYALQHRGQESAGIAVNDDGVFRAWKDVGLVNEVFTAEHLAALGEGSAEVGTPEPGPASILTTLEGRRVRSYSVEIVRVYSDGGAQRMLLTVTDPLLRELSGGIVQGMSGSPILQNGKLVGAVTHVLINDPCRGYGISIGDMLEEAGIARRDLAA